MDSNYKKVTKILWIILFANYLVSFTKIIVGNSINSSSLVADGFHSFADGSSNIVGLIGIKFASKPIDKDHPYGHKKFEMLSSLFISGMLFFISGKIIFDSIERFFNPSALNISFPSLVALLVTLGINILVATLEYKKGKKLNSHILISDSIHTRSDIFVSAGVLITLILIKSGLHHIIDPIVSLVVAIFIIHAAYEIFKSSSGVLVDKNVIERDEIRKIVLKYPEVKNIHNIRSRGREDDVYVDLHIMLNPDMNIKESHDLIHIIEEDFKENINNSIQIIAHFEPYIEKF